MAFQATLPMIIMAGALSVAGAYTGGVYKKRQVHEHSAAWETGLRQVCGVIPPRTHVDPFIAKPHPALAGREVPIYDTGAMLSQIVPGGKLDPYANPPASAADMAKESQRLLEFGYISKDEIAEIKLEQQALKEEMAAREVESQFACRALYRADPMAEYYRIMAYQKLHPELVLDEEKFKSKVNVEKLRNWY